jgi:uncharacterized NAD(P)/FAD-binding protein YdhS
VTPGTCVAIIGLGSRGLGVLERIVTLAKNVGPPASPIQVEVIDPTCAGSGVHDTEQPDYLLLNTTCSQVSMFPDSCTVGADVDEPGPSLYEWVTERGLRMGDDGFTVGRVGRAIRPSDFLPRRVLGEYLGWFLEQLRRRAPEQVHITVHHAAAIDISAEPDESVVIALSDGSRVGAHFAFLTTGYTSNECLSEPVGGRRIINDPYPLPRRVADIAPTESVGIGGFGLSAMDLMSCLTVGRGGRFVADGVALRYIPSGLEPTLLMYSRSGVPCRARPLVVEFGPKYEPLVFTETAIDALRVAREGPLDFDRDVLPLVFAEMRIAYRRCQARCAGGDAYRALERDLINAGGPAGICAQLDELDARLGRFDPLSTFDGSTGMSLDGSEAYQEWLTGVMKRDLDEAALGFAGSPVKAALDILRELRDTVRHAVDFGGLTDRSLDEFTRWTVPSMNRAVVGPQYERHAELIALMSAGVTSAPFGPAPSVTWNDGTGRWTLASTHLDTAQSREADWIVSAHVPPPAVESSASPLLRALHHKGWIRPHRPASRYVHGIDVDPDQHPLDAQGQPDRRLWVLGPLCEGATFYNNLVPSPNVWSRPLFDAHRCVVELFAAERIMAESA